MNLHPSKVTSDYSKLSDCHSDILQTVE